MKKLSFAEYKDKVTGCWTGKNIGGVFGAPFEGFRQINDVDFYVQDLSQGPPANDDLDLQIVWLAAVEKYGRAVDASILGEYWLSFVIPNWVEYGTGKANLRAGLMPPLSGLVDNQYKDSCGCFIRSEIWACLAPGHPEIAARYAFEDGIVDHSGEGVFGEIFCAALQSAAFVEKRKDVLLDIALSYIPEDCAVAKGVRKARECYEKAVPVLEARREIHNLVPGTFGVQNFPINELPEKGNDGMVLGEPGFDAPENVAFVVVGWLYGEDDFGKSMRIANSMGEDTDCTCATLGALLGILNGESGLPAKWKDPLDDRIVTLCIDKTSMGVWVPETATQLADRVMRNVPGFLGTGLVDIFDPEGMSVLCREGKELYCPAGEKFQYRTNGTLKSEELSIRQLCELSPYVVRYSFPAFSVQVDYQGSVGFSRDEQRKIKVSVVNANALCQQQWVNIRVYMPSGVRLISGEEIQLPLNNLYGVKAETEIVFVPEEYAAGRLEFIVDISLVGRHSDGAVKIVLMREK